jgi:hypothetical protein
MIYKLLISETYNNLITYYFHYLRNRGMQIWQNLILLLHASHLMDQGPDSLPLTPGS